MLALPRPLMEGLSLIPRCVLDLVRRATGHGAPHKSVGTLIGWMTWHQGPDLSCGPGVDHPWCIPLKNGSQNKRYYVYLFMYLV